MIVQAGKRTFSDAINKKEEITSILRKKNFEKLNQNPNIDVITAKASFVNPHVISYENEKGTKEIYGDYLFVNTGSVPIIPNIQGIEHTKHIYVSADIMKEKEQPKTLAIIGGGYIGLEFSSMFARYGTQAVSYTHLVCLLTDSSRGHAQLLVERLRKLVPEINEIRVEGIHDFKLEEQAEMDMIITPHTLPFHDKRIVEISNILSDGGILKLRSHMEELNLKTDDVPNPFSPICFPLFSPDLIFMNLDVKDKTELLIYLSQQMENKGFVTGKFCESVLDVYKRQLAY